MKLLARILFVATACLLLAVLMVSRDRHPGNVALSLDPVESLAARNGPRIVVELNGQMLGELSATSPSLSVPARARENLAFAYVGPDGAETDVAWTQLVPPNGELVVVQPWRRPPIASKWHILAWAFPEQPKSALVHAKKTVTVVSPMWWTIDPEGALQSATDPKLIKTLQRKGIAVWPAIQAMNADGLHAFLSDPARRSEVAALVSSEAEKLGAQGVNIDIEGFRAEDSDAASAFVEELASLVHAWEGIVSYDLVARSDHWEILPAHLAFWSSAPQRRRLAAAVDYTILMAYDQFNDHRPAGPVAAPNWVEEVLVYLLRYADPHTIMLGVPAYGRVWNPETLGKPRALPLFELDGSDGVRGFDKVHCIDLVTLPDGRFYWLEKDVEKTRLRFAAEFDLAGIAVWRLGLDDKGLWRAVRNAEKKRRMTSETTSEISDPSSASGDDPCR